MNIIGFFKDNRDKFVILVLLTWVLTGLFIIFYILSYFVTVLGSLLVFIMLVMSLIYFATRIATFPGAFFLWRRTLEKSCLHKISINAQSKLEILKFMLICIQESTFHTIYDRISFHTLQSIPKTLEKIIKNLEYLKTISITPEQSKALNLFLALDQSIKKIILSVKNREKSLYMFLIDPKVYTNPVFNSTDEVKIAIELCNSIQILIQQSIKDTNTLKDLLNFRQPVLFGSLDYMRSEVINKHKAEQVWIESYDKTKIDWY